MSEQAELALPFGQSWLTEKAGLRVCSRAWSPDKLPKAKENLDSERSFRARGVHCLPGSPHGQHLAGTPSPFPGSVGIRRVLSQSGRILDRSAAGQIKGSYSTAIIYLFMTF